MSKHTKHLRVEKIQSGKGWGILHSMNGAIISGDFDSEKDAQSLLDAWSLCSVESKLLKDMPNPIHPKVGDNISFYNSETGTKYNGEVKEICGAFVRVEYKTQIIGVVTKFVHRADIDSIIEEKILEIVKDGGVKYTRYWSLSLSPHHSEKSFEGDSKNDIKPLQQAKNWAKKNGYDKLVVIKVKGCKVKGYQEDKVYILNK